MNRSDHKVMKVANKKALNHKKTTLLRITMNKTHGNKTVKTKVLSIITI